MIDTHSHLYAEEFLGDIDAVIERSRASGVNNVFLPAIDGCNDGVGKKISWILYADDGFASMLC